MEFHTGMSQQGRQTISDALAQLLADSYAVYLKTQNFHWNLTGAEFYSLHLLFEKQYEELADALDEIAERIRALGFYVEASFAAFKQQTAIADEGRVLATREMIQHLIQGHEVVIRQARTLARSAEKENDQATIDLMGRRLNVHEKFAWMLRSQL